MKLFFFAFILSLSTVICYGQCNPYFVLNEGVKWEVRYYDAKGKVQYTNRYQVSSLSESGNGYKADIELKVNNKDNEEVFTQAFNVACNDGTLYYDMKQFMPQQSQGKLKDFKVEYNGENLQYPNVLNVGDELEETQMLITMTSESMSINLDMIVKITDRKVEAKEIVTTPAGKFECYKITSIMTSESGGIIETESIEWVALGQGIIKTEVYIPNGSMVHYSEMISYTE